MAIVYTVKQGDTLDKIAKKFGTTYQQLTQSNQIADPNRIEVGQEIMISMDSPIVQQVKKVVKGITMVPSHGATAYNPQPKSTTIFGIPASYLLWGGGVFVGILTLFGLTRGKK